MGGFLQSSPKDGGIVNRLPDIRMVCYGTLGDSKADHLVCQIGRWGLRRDRDRKVLGNLHNIVHPGRCIICKVVQLESLLHFFTPSPMSDTHFQLILSTSSLRPLLSAPPDTHTKSLSHYEHPTSGLTSPI